MLDPRETTGLVTDLYELTMACGYWAEGMTETEAVFNAYFRQNPFGGGFAIACGLEPILDGIARFRFDEDDRRYLASLNGRDGKPLFRREFVEFLADFRFRCDVDAVPEGTVVFPNEPLVRVRGPIVDAQLVESLILNQVNFGTLIATKAARLALAAAGQQVVDFGLRRAQGYDGALTAARSAYLGGCTATSNVLAGKRYGIPVAGTHAHSWVMAFDDELESFRAWGRVMPNNAVFLVDTYDSIEGVRHAIAAAKEMREAGAEMIGIRLDSGDLAWLSREARRLLDEAGFSAATITASNDLDEQIVRSLREQEAAIDVWGVGTRLVTAWDQPALGGVYKMTALRRPGAEWEHRIKVSDQTAKVSIPGILGVRRFRAAGEYTADMIYDELAPPSGETTIVDPVDPTRRKTIATDWSTEELLVPVLRGGERVAPAVPLEESRQRAKAQLSTFHGGIKRFVNPHRYPVGLEQGLGERRTALILAAREKT